MPKGNIFTDCLLQNPSHSDHTNHNWLHTEEFILSANSVVANSSITNRYHQQYMHVVFGECSHIRTFARTNSQSHVMFVSYFQFLFVFPVHLILLIFYRNQTSPIKIFHMPDYIKRYGWKKRNLLHSNMTYCSSGIRDRDSLQFFITFLALWPATMLKWVRFICPEVSSFQTIIAALWSCKIWLTGQHRRTCLSRVGCRVVNLPGRDRY